MARIIALYEGRTIGDARLVAVSADPQLVRYVLAQLVGGLTEGEPEPPPRKPLRLLGPGSAA